MPKIRPRSKNYLTNHALTATPETSKSLEKTAKILKRPRFITPKSIALPRYPAPKPLLEPTKNRLTTTPASSLLIDVLLSNFNVSKSYITTLSFAQKFICLNLLELCFPSETFTAHQLTQPPTNLKNASLDPIIKLQTQVNYLALIASQCKEAESLASLLSDPDKNAELLNLTKLCQRPNCTLTDLAQIFLILSTELLPIMSLAANVPATILPTTEVRQEFVRLLQKLLTKLHVHQHYVRQELLKLSQLLKERLLRHIPCAEQKNYLLLLNMLITCRGDLELPQELVQMIDFILTQGSVTATC